MGDNCNIKMAMVSKLLSNRWVAKQQNKVASVWLRHVLGAIHHVGTSVVVANRDE